VVSPLHLAQTCWGATMTLRIKRLRETPGTRLCLCGELRSAHLIDLRAEIELCGQSAILDLEEVNVVDIDGIRLLNECQAKGIQVVNCSPYIREWMLQEKRAHRGEE
jgi:hypothetical protein